MFSGMSCTLSSRRVAVTTIVSVFSDCACAGIASVAASAPAIAAESGWRSSAKLRRDDLG
jgi:hypothetical protein